MTSPNFRQIELYAAIMRTGSASGAAELLGITQPAVSRALAGLERDLGFALFDRARQRLMPTAEGRLFFAAVEDSFRGLDTLRAEAARIRDRGTGRLRVASLAALGSTVVPRAIRLFREAHPDIVVTLHVLPSRDVRNLVASGEFDLGLAAEEVDTTGLSHRVFVTPRAHCLLPKGHGLAAREVVRLADLHGQDYVAYVPEDRGRQRLWRMLDEAGVKPKVVVETIYAATLCALVAEGVGIGLASSYALTDADRMWVEVRPFEPALETRALLIMPPGRPRSRLVRDFVNALMMAR